MVDQYKKLSELTELSMPSNGDILYIVHNPATFPIDNKITFYNLLKDWKTSVIVDTKDNILIMTPTTGWVAYATDTKRFYIYDGTNWQEGATQFSIQTANPNIGVEQNESRQGYGSDYITDKVLTYCIIGGSGDDKEGSIRVINGLFQIYLNNKWNNIVSNFILREDSLGNFELEHAPAGFEWYYEVFSGNSDIIGIDGKPIIQQYTSSMGAYQPDLQLDGGSF